MAATSGDHHQHNHQHHHPVPAARSSTDAQTAAAPSSTHHKSAPSSGDHHQEKEVLPVSEKGYIIGEGSQPDKVEHHHLDAKASRLLKSAQRASEAAKRAYAVGIESTQARAKQVSDVVLENAHRAGDSSKIFLSKVASKAGHFADKAHSKASTYKGNVSRAIQLPKDEEGNSVGFPLSIMVWCSTLCGRSKKESKVSHECELAPETEEEFSMEFLASTADEYATTLEEEASKLEEAVAAQENKKQPHPSNPKLASPKS